MTTTTPPPEEVRVQEIAFSDWNCDHDFQDTYPFEDTKCATCSRSIGGYLGYNEETTADVPKFDSIWVFEGQPLCEDCIPEGVVY